MMLLEMVEGRHRLVLVPFRIPYAMFRATNAFSKFKILLSIFSFVVAFSSLVTCIFLASADACKSSLASLDLYLVLGQLND